jgi:CRISPR system Cascade subunit CasE
MPRDREERISTSHRLVWTLFGNPEDRVRDFLWREDDQTFYILSQREPTDENNLFDIDTKEYDVEFTKGQVLRFVLRANMARSIPVEIDGKLKSKKVDILAKALAARMPGEDKWDVIRQTTIDWLKFQSSNSIEVSERDFEVRNQLLTVPHRNATQQHNRTGDITYASAEISGVLRITDPETFKAKMFSGFGKMKAFGNGLLLVKRLH